ncbi:MAG: alpha-L-fucosidase [Bacteroidales bacterium]|nr:alpha-L-fucosidase [Bacteroidales bacterium]
MKNFIYLLAACLFMLPLSVHAQDGYVPAEENLKARENFEDMRFGIFLHWGIYSMFAQGEWYLEEGRLNAQEYAKAAGGFYPADFDAREWVKAIKASGAKYICFTSRHHDGFSMFDTSVSDYDIVDSTPFKRDIIAELARACHEEDIALHFYYSLADWTREDYPVGKTGHHTGRKGDSQDYDSYLRFMKDQIAELLTKYGKIGAMWFDGFWDHDSDPTPFDWRLPEIYEHIHTISPACLIGNNHHRAVLPGEDFQMFERDLPGGSGWSKGKAISDLPLEMCQTMNGMWGYKIADQDYMSAEELIRLIVRASSKGSNLLINIGPQPDGKLPQTALDRLSAVGEWMNVYGGSVYGTGSTGIPEPEWGVTTCRDSLLFLHVFDTQDSGQIELPVDSISRNGRFKVRSVKAMKDGRPLKYKVTDGKLVVTLAEVPAEPDYVIEVCL